ncbi:MAG TPA: ATP-binding protein [Chitinispirillaceae bacterium]|nr:ATP-binding protein [Chitinispirillaceae bacterium]
MPHLSITGLTNEYQKEFFSHVDVEILPLEAMERDRLRDWMPHTNRNSLELFSILRDEVGRAARVKATFTSHQLRKSLLAMAPDLHFDKVADIDSLRRAIYDCGALLRQHNHRITGANIHIKQEVVNNIIQWLTEEPVSDKNISMLLDQAGMGKTVVLHDVLYELENWSIDVLAVKADQQFSNVKDLADIQKKLDLPYPLVQIVGRLAQLKPVVILIDQIDALSLSLAHDQQTLDVVLDLIARLRLIPNVRILLSCRIFDRNTDPRLRTIEIAQSFNLSKLSEKQVQDVLNALHINYNQLSSATKELLTTPLHLDLFSRAVASKDVGLSQLYGISSLQELYALIWQNVILRQGNEAVPLSERIEVINLVTDYMDSQQRTTAPQSILQTTKTSHLEKAVNWLASAGILVHGKFGWNFLHQTFFDYCYARRFVETGESLPETILNSDQGVFERSKLIQIIGYLRGYDHDHYIVDLQHLLDSDKLRFHLYDLLIRWFGSLSNPTDDEWIIASRILQNDTKFDHLLNSMHGKVDWFHRLQPKIANWLLAEKRRNITLFYLDSLIDGEEQEKVIALLEPFVDKDENITDIIARILFRMEIWRSDNAIKLYEKLFYRLTDLSRMNTLYLKSICVKSPETGCRLIRHVLDQALISYIAKNPKRYSLILEDELRHLEGTIEEVFGITSTNAPKQYLNLMLPWLEKVLMVTESSERREKRFFSDPLSYNWYENVFRVSIAFVHSLINSLTEIAKSEPDVFRPIAARLAGIPYLTPQLLLAHVYRTVSEEYSDDIYDFLVNDQRRLELGEHEQYDTRQLLLAAFPHFSIEQKNNLEKIILSYLPIYKFPNMGAGTLRWSGLEQFRLLHSIPYNLLSPAGQRRLDQWKRKFPNVTISDKPIHGEFGMVGSPIERDLANKMSDQSWLRAMRKYQKDVRHKEFLKGGSGQLAGVLAEMVKNDPKRFYNLFQKTPLDLDDSYVLAFANGFAEAVASPVEWFFEVFRRHASQNERHIRRGLAFAIEKIKNDVPDDVTAVLLQWVHGSLEEDELWWSKGDNHGDVYSSYLNSDRGAAMGALMRILSSRNTSEAIDQKWRLLTYISDDPSAALRIGAIHELTYMIRHDPERSWKLFEKLITGNENLIGTPYVREFLYWSMYKNFFGIKPYIEYMMQNLKPEVQKMGAELACIASISDVAMESQEAIDAAALLANQAMCGEEVLRQGAAHIFSFNIAKGSETNVRSLCLEKVLYLLDDESHKIKDEIEHIFLSLNESHFFELRRFMDDYALSENHPLTHPFAEYIWKFGMLDPSWSLTIVEKAIDKSKPTNSWRSGVEEITRFTLRVYTSQTIEKTLREKALDIFDLIMKQNASTANKVLDEWDRR